MAKINRINWDEALGTGEPDLDNQHKALIQIFNDLANAIERGPDRDNLGEILAALKHYAEWHFSCEEDCMTQYQCPVADQNQKAHKVFIQRLAGFEQEFTLTNDVTDFSLRLHNSLARWIYTHMLEVDAKLYHSIHSTSFPRDA